MLVQLRDGKKTIGINADHVLYVKPCFSSSDLYPRTDIVFGTERRGISSLLWFLFPDPVITVDGAAEAIIETLNKALPEPRLKLDRTAV